MIPGPTAFGLDVGPSDRELGFPDTNIYVLFLNFYVSKHITLFDTYLKASISFKLSLSGFIIPCK